MSEMGVREVGCEIDTTFKALIVKSDCNEKWD
jgi:hypothetical protein